MENLYSITGAAKKIGVSRQHIYNLHDRNLLPFVEICGMKRVRESDLEKLIKPVADNKSKKGE